jgi:hypothetical protein
MVRNIAPVYFAAEASDDTGVVRVDFLVDGATVGSDSTAPYALDWNSASGTDRVKSIAASAVDGAAYSPCSSPVSYAGLGNGGHTFRVRAGDGLGNVDQTPAARAWTVDATPPETTIDFGPSGAVASRSATFSVSANESASFGCSLDGAPPTPCSSPVRYDRLRRGTLPPRRRRLFVVVGLRCGRSSVSD